MGVTAKRLACALAALLLVAVASAVPVEPVLTAEDVRRIALASAPGSGAANARVAAASGLQQAKALGIPINQALLRNVPTTAQVGSPCNPLTAA